MIYNDQDDNENGTRDGPIDPISSHHGVIIYFSAWPGDDPIYPGHDLYLAPMPERKGVELCGVKCPQHPHYWCSRSKKHDSDHCAYGSTVVMKDNKVLTESERRDLEKEIPPYQQNTTNGITEIKGVRKVVPMMARWSHRIVKMGPRGSRKRDKRDVEIEATRKELEQRGS